MSTAAATTDTLDLAGIRARIDAALAGYLRGPPGTLPPERGQERAYGHGQGSAYGHGQGSEYGDALSGALADFVLAPAKRIRPLLCVLGWHAAGGTGAEESVLRAAMSLELFHAFALIHDDIMDASATRRGLPSIHRAFAARHSARPDADAFGTGAAILVGDLALVRSDEVLHTARLSEAQLTAVMPLLAAMRNEVVLGQWLDLLGTGPPADDLERALTVARFKTAKYTFERPLQMGAALAGAGAALQRAASAYAIPLGEAFQLRDDLLGTFGDPAVTGKSALEDLRSGKPTALVALAVRYAAPAQRERLAVLVGSPSLDEAGAAEARGLLEATGARETVESMIEDRHDEALAALDAGGFAPPATAALRRIAVGALSRTA